MTVHRNAVNVNPEPSGDAAVTCVVTPPSPPPVKRKAGSEAPNEGTAKGGMGCVKALVRGPGCPRWSVNSSESVPLDPNSNSDDDRDEVCCVSA